MVDTLIVAPWGNMYMWDIVNYKLENGQNKEIKVPGRTSLGAISKAYPNARILIAVADTVYAGHKGRKGCEPSRRTKEIPESYEKLIEYTKKNTREWILECSGSEPLLKALEEDRIRIIVIPGIGFYKLNNIPYIFPLSEGEPVSVYASWLSLTVLEELLSHKGIERVVVDITHGLNHMPLASVEAVDLVVRAYSIGFSKKIEELVFESEPYSPVRDEIQELRIMQVRREEITVDEVLDSVASDVRKARRNGGRHYILINSSNNKFHKEINRKYKEILGKRTRTQSATMPYGIAAANIILYAMPLAAAYLAREYRNEIPSPEKTALEKTKLILEELYKLSLELGKKNETGDNEIEYVPGIIPIWENIKPFILSAGLLDAIKNTVKEAEINLDELHQEGVDLEKLKKIAGKLGKIYKAIAVNELNSIENGCLLKKEKEKVQCFLEIGESEWPGLTCDNSSISSMNPRNLKAHAGLEKNIIEAKKHDSTLKLRYRLEKDKPTCWRDLLEKKLDRPDF